MLVVLFINLIGYTEPGIMSKPTLSLTGNLLLSILLLPLFVEAQNFTVETIALLPLETNESSGVIFLNDKLITHNDSAGEAILYEVDPDSGTLIRQLVVENASNVDWEDLCFDQQYIYIGDFGNNSGDRTDLKIYRVSLQEYFQSSNDTVSADTIRFAYSDQESFEPGNKHNFDAEALISFEDSLYIFTKNRGDFHSNIYSVPKIPGDYKIKRVGRINSNGLITGGVHNPLSQEIMLTGYTLTEPFLLRLSQFSGREFAEGEMHRLTFQVDGSYQIEAIEAINEKDYYITSETNKLGEATLYRVNTDFVVSTQNPFTADIQYFPNPVNKLLNIRGLQNPGEISLALFNTMGKQAFYHTAVTRTEDETIKFNLDGVPAGIYLMHLTAQSIDISRKLIIRQSGF